jgi:hypothetical protein
MSQAECAEESEEETGGKLQTHACTHAHEHKHRDTHTHSRELWACCHTNISTYEFMREKVTEREHAFAFAFVCLCVCVCVFLFYVLLLRSIHT